MNLDIFRGPSINLTIKIDDDTRLISQLLGEDIIRSSFNSRNILDITIGDYVIYNNVKYYVNNLPNIKKNSSNSFDYDIIFESEYYELCKTQFMDLDANSDFYLVGNVETFIDLIVTNMNRTHASWAKGTCNQTNTDYKLLSFSESNCMQVLQRLCEEFEGEFYFDGKDICFTDKAGSDSGLTFGYHQGLRNIQRTTLSEKNIVTRLYAFGSKRNLISDYRDYSRRLKFVVDGKSYLEKNIAEYGIIEHTEIFNDIYPHRTGTISSVDGADITKFTDNGMDFNLNDFLLPGITAKLHFNSGNLGGYEFEVYSYNNATKEFTIIKFTDEQGYDMPNATLKPAIGDKYVLLDIEMPQTYIDTAETNLLAKAQAYLDDNCGPRVTYILEPDWRYFKANLVELKIGDSITIEDTDLDTNILTRIVELTKSLANEYKYTLKLSDHLEPQLIQRLYSEQEGLKQKIEIGDVGNIIRSRWSWRTSEELRTMVFDTDGYFDMGNIRPASVETGMLSVGAKSTQFILKEVQVEANYTGDKSKFYASAGELIHLSIAEEIMTWTLSENTQDSLVDATAYYIYAKCTKEPGYTGQIVVDETQRKFDDDPTYYYFLIGVLHSVAEGVRGVSLTYGQTIINGKFITTGSIIADRLNISNVADIGNIILGNTGYIRTTGKDSYVSPTGSITNIIDYGATVPGTIKITSAIHNLSTDNVVVITGTTNYDGTYTITVVDANDYYVTATYVADETSGTWELSIGGIWLGYDVDKYKLNIGNASRYLKWTGTALEIKGDLLAGLINGAELRVGGSGSDQEIYFKDSAVYMYDFLDGYAAGYKGLALKYSTKRFFDVNYNGEKAIAFVRVDNAYAQMFLESGLAVFGTTENILALATFDKDFYFYSTGQFWLPNLASDPTENNEIGQICMVDGNLKRWDGNNWVAVAGGGGYTNLTQFIAQTPWRLFCSNQNGVVTEFGLGAAGTYLKSTGAASPPMFDTPAGGGVEVAVVATADTENATLSLADATGLAFALLANSTYIIEGFIIYSAYSVGDGILLSATGPASPTLMAGIYQVNMTTITAGTTSFNADNVGVAMTGSMFTTGNTASLHSVVRTGANAGIFQVRFASEANGHKITIKAGSTLRYRKVA